MSSLQIISWILYFPEWWRILLAQEIIKDGYIFNVSNLSRVKEILREVLDNVRKDLNKNLNTIMDKIDKSEIRPESSLPLF